MSDNAEPDVFQSVEFESVDSKVAIGVGYLPGRASLCVYVHRPGVVEDATAYFRGTPSEQRARARKLVAALRELTNAKEAPRD
jgi:hypothetical protein